MSLHKEEYSLHQGSRGAVGVSDWELASLEESSRLGYRARKLSHRWGKPAGPLYAIMSDRGDIFSTHTVLDVPISKISLLSTDPRSCTGCEAPVAVLTVGQERRTHIRWAIPGRIGMMRRRCR